MGVVEPDATGGVTRRDGHGRTLSIGALLLVILIDCVSYAVVVPLLPFLVLNEARGAGAGALLVGGHALAGIIAAPLFGLMASRVGERRLLVASLVGAAASYMILAIFDGFLALSISRLLAGVMSGNMAVVFAGLARRSSDAERPRMMAGATSAVAIGFVLGPAVGALVARYAADLALGLGVSAAILTLLACVPLILWWRPSPPAIISLARPSATAARARAPLLVALTFTTVAQGGLLAMTGFWAVAALGWGPMQVSLLMIWCAGVIVLVQALLIGRLAAALGEVGGAIGGSAASVIGALLLFWLPPSDLLIALAAPLGFAGLTVSVTMLNSGLSKTAAPSEQGWIMGLANSAGGAGRVVGPVAFGWAFLTLGLGGPYLAAAVSGAAVLACLLISRRSARNHRMTRLASNIRGETRGAD